MPAAMVKRQPYGITYDQQRLIWATDPPLDRIYRLTPATTPNQTLTSAWEWALPNIIGKRNPSQIITDTAHTCAYFTNYYSRQLSQLNWTSNWLVDWPLGNYGLVPWDLVMDKNGDIWFTSINSTMFGRLNPTTNLLTLWSLPIGTAPSALFEIATNGSSVYMTDYKLDNLYELRVATFPASGLLVYPLPVGGLAACVASDPANNIWVTQPVGKVVDEQMAGSNYKQKLDLSGWSTTTSPEWTALNRLTIDVRIQLATVTADTYATEPEVIADPLNVFHVPTAMPWSIATGIEPFAWFTQPWGNQIGAIDPASSKTWEYTLPTANALPLYITVLPSLAIEPEHVWFTEPPVGKIGELFEGIFVDVRVCPSRPPQYPPPNPGSIRWTWEPGAEIWIDAPSNGFNPLDHDIPERPAINHLYAKVKNQGTSDATNVLVKFYYFNMSVGFPEFIPLPPAAPSTTYWVFIGSVNIASLPASAETSVYVDWNVNSSVPDHQCIGVQVGCAADINLYDNVAYRNFDVVSVGGAAGTPVSVPFWITNPEDTPGMVRVGLSGVPSGWQAYVEPNDFKLAGGASCKLTLHVQVPTGTQNSTEALMTITGTINQEVTGYCWVLIKFKGMSHITCVATPGTVPQTQTVTISGGITPVRAWVKVTVLIGPPNEPWYVLYQWTDASGQYSVTTLANNNLGTYTVTASWQGDNTLFGASASTTYDITSPLIPPSLYMGLGIGFAAGFGVMLLIALLTRRKPKAVPARQR
jgi:streptogramin lyase